MRAKITPAMLRDLSPKDKPFEVFDTETKGLVLRVEPTGSKSYFLVYHLDGRKRRYRIGDAKTITPRQARDVATIQAGEIAKGADPGAERKQKRTEQQAAKFQTVGGFLLHHYGPFLLSERKSGKLTERRLKACFDWLENKPMHEITPFLLQSWRKRQLDGGKSPITVNRDLADLKAMLAKAVELGLLAVHPLARLKPAKAEDNSRIRHLSPDEEKRLFTALDNREAESRAARIRFNKWRRERKQEPLPETPEGAFTDHLKPLVLLALHTGLRRGELFSAEWRDIDFLSNRLIVRAAAAKGAKPRHIPLNGIARDTLKQWQKQTRDMGLIFPGAKGGRLDNIASSWRKLMTDAELQDFTFHDLRHTFATKTLAAGADIVTVSKLLGHASLKMTMRYVHITDGTMTAAVERLTAQG
jgi:integrase